MKDEISESNKIHFAVMALGATCKVNDFNRLSGR